MPSNRPRPIRLNATPRSKSGAGKSPKSPKKSSPRKSESTILTWTAIILSLLLVALIVVYTQIPRIKGQRTKPPTQAEAENPFEAPPAPEPVTKPSSSIAPPTPAPAPIVTQTPTLPAPAVPKPLVVPKTLKERADEETRHLVERPVPVQPVAPPVKPETKLTPAPFSLLEPPPDLPPPVVKTVTAPGAKPIPSAPLSEAQPPVAQPVPLNQKAGTPARALPLDPGKLDTERIAAYQVALERIHFSCGFVDGDQGMRTQRMLRAFQTSRGLPVTGVLDPATREAIGEPGEPFISYTVTKDDIASIMPKPATWKEKSQATRLGYNNIWDLLGEKFHCARSYLKAINPGVKDPVVGTEIVGPKVYPGAPMPKIASLRILLGETSIEALDANGKIVAFFPCSIAKDKDKRPHGLLTVKVVDPHPDYTFDPALFADAAKAEGLTKKMMIPPGPRNPVGTTWIGLSLPGYGIHGTPEPENISRTQSHGCFRLANWNAEKVLKMVKVGTPVDVEP